MINTFDPQKIWRKCMEKNILIVLIVFLMTSFAFASEAQKSTRKIGQLTVIIVGLENDEGEVKIGLFDSKDSYFEEGEPFRGTSVVIKDRKAECTFKGIPYGTYAIKAYHDKNRNSKLDMNFMGIPNESYGFSNNARGNFGPAKWEDAKFVIKSKNMSMEIIFAER